MKVVSWRCNWSPVPCIALDGLPIPGACLSTGLDLGSGALEDGKTGVGFINEKNLLVQQNNSWILPSWVKISQHLVRCCIDVTQMFSLVTCLFFVIYPAVTQRCCLQAWTCCIQELERLQDILSFADDGAFYAGEESEFGPVPVAKIKETIGNIGFKWFKCIVHWEGLQYPIWQDWQVTTFCLSGCKWGKSWQ